jgi:hypothetical protein
LIDSFIEKYSRKEIDGKIRNGLRKKNSMDNENI